MVGVAEVGFRAVDVGNDVGGDEDFQLHRVSLKPKVVMERFHQVCIFVEQPGRTQVVSCM